MTAAKPLSSYERRFPFLQKRIKFPLVVEQHDEAAKEEGI